MRCPICGDPESRVIDSRPSDDGAAIRRRRECKVCGRRFNTFERVEEAPLLVLKRRPGVKEPFDPGKLIAGLEKACKNLPISQQAIVRIASDIEETLRARRQREVESQEIGIEAMNALKDLHPVAYMRFKSVYHAFQDLPDFERELDNLMPLRKSTPPKPRPAAAPSRS